MCRERDSITAVNQAADALAEACLKICPDDVELALRAAFDKVIVEEIPAELTELLGKLQ